MHYLIFHLAHLKFFKYFHTNPSFFSHDDTQNKVLANTHKKWSNVFIRRNGNLSSTLEHNLLHIKIRCTIRNCILKCNFMFISWPSFTYLHCMHQYDNIYIYWIELSLVYISPTSNLQKVCRITIEIIILISNKYIICGL